ncbi:sensor histidine kinase [Luteolibacter arcticus]|uniref:Oxygen sensor histidine kinase NreB n=1 Tax=Luteolibacter arcticus TaxID=1581411 RepID=A0ABT3GE37_9BACT|nr:sensor histidine kinase [Luteolibacter arcticus]MCW1921884.1 sensor histidine kinase [Luteolibacter arcticus]
MRLPSGDAAGGQGAGGGNSSSLHASTSRFHACPDRLVRMMERSMWEQSSMPGAIRNPARRVAAGCLLAGWIVCLPAGAAILWQRPQETLVRDNGQGEDILHDAISPRDDSASGTLYFRFTADPQSDVLEEAATRQSYLAGLVLYQDGVEKLGIGNASHAWGFGAFSPPFRFPRSQPGELTFNTGQPETIAPNTYEGPRRGVRKTIIVKVDFVPNGEDLVTVWLDPDLSPGATESSQPEKIVTRFKTDASFDQLRLVHRGTGLGWTFKEIAIANSFEDFVPIPFWRRGWVIALAGLATAGLVIGGVVTLERRRARRQMQVMERQQAVTAERVRIAQDLHDDLGAKVTEIVLLGELAKGGGTEMDSDKTQIRSILDGLRQLHASLDEAVWSINPRNDSLADLVDFISDFAQRFLQHAAVDFHLEVAGDLPPLVLSATQRHNLTLAVKEALNNAVRHAAATTIWLRFAVGDGRLSITVADNGRGMKEAPEKAGDGLQNMRSRLQSIGGSTEITSTLGGGTTVTFWLPLAS